MGSWVAGSMSSMGFTNCKGGVAGCMSFMTFHDSITQDPAGDTGRVTMVKCPKLCHKAC